MALITRLFVGNLPDNFSEHALREAFSSYGEIINFDLKCKPGIESDNKRKFAFVTLDASNYNVESCIKYFTTEDFHGNRLYVTRARESFLERLQREREQSKAKSADKNHELHVSIEKKNVGDHCNFHKRRFDNDEESHDKKHNKKSKVKAAHGTINHTSPVEPHSAHKHSNNTFQSIPTIHSAVTPKKSDNLFQNDEKKQNSDKKRQESMKKKRQEFNEKKNIIKTGLVSIDKQSNKKIIFSDNEEDDSIKEKPIANGHVKYNHNHKSNLFDEGGSDDDINFEVKEQYEGKKGQKVLDLQSRYKSDKRFNLDERFVEDSGSEKDEDQMEQEEVDLNQVDEKSKQLNILQDVLGVTIKSKTIDTTSKAKVKLGMLRFDPTQPEHAKYLVPVTKEESTKKSKKKKNKENKDEEVQHQEPERVVEKVEVSKDQFYKVSDSLKEAIAQPTTFSLRSLFTKDNDNQQEDATEENANYIPLQSKKDTKVKNPLDPGERNPFVYDSSESENEEEDNSNDNNMKSVQETNEIKTVWREKLFLSTTDHRLKEGLIFFGKPYGNEAQKERRELKSLMKKRIYNKERKNTMFQKKIGGRKKTIRKKFVRKN